MPNIITGSTLPLHPPAPPERVTRRLPVIGSFSYHGINAPALFTPRSLKDLPSFYRDHAKWTNCITGERIPVTELRKIDEMPAAARRFVFFSDLSRKDLETAFKIAKQWEKRSGTPPANPLALQTLWNRENVRRSASADQLKQELLNLHAQLKKQKEKDRAQSNPETRAPSAALRGILKGIRYTRKHYEWNTHGGESAREFINRPAGTANVHGILRLRSMFQNTGNSDDVHGSAATEYAMLAPADRAIIAKHFPYIDPEQPLETLVRAKLANTADIEDALRQMTASDRALHVVCIPGDNDGSYRTFVVTENPDAPGNWFVHTMSAAPISGRRNNYSPVRDIDEDKPDELLSATWQRGQELIKARQELKAINDKIRERQESVKKGDKGGTDSPASGASMTDEEKASLDAARDRLRKTEDAYDEAVWKLVRHRTKSDATSPFQKSPRPFESADAKKKKKDERMERIRGGPLSGAARSKDPQPSTGGYVEDNELYESSGKFADALRYIFHGATTSRRKQPVTILSVSDSIMETRLNEFEILEYEVDESVARYSIRDCSIADAMRRLGCDVSEIVLEPDDPEIAKCMEDADNCAIVLEIERNDEVGKQTMIWNESAPDTGQDPDTGETFDGSPFEFWKKKIVDAAVPLKRISKSMISPSVEAISVGMLTGETAEEVQLALAAAARQQGLPAGILSGFADLSHFFVSHNEGAVAAYYDLGSKDTPRNQGLGAALDNAPHPILIEYDDTKGVNDVKREVFYPVSDPDALRPSGFLNKIRRETGGTIRLLSMGPLPAAVIDSKELEIFVNRGLEFLSSTGVGFDHRDEEEKRAFARFIRENYGGVPHTEHILLDIYAGFFDHYNKTAPSEEEILIKRKRIAAGPMDVAATPCGMLIQFTRNGLQTVSSHLDESKKISFIRNHKVIESVGRLEQIAEQENWQASGAIDILQFQKAEVRVQERRRSQQQ